MRLPYRLASEMLPAMQTPHRNLCLAATLLCLTGCDAWYYRSIDVAAADSATFTVDSPSTEQLLSTLREYAADQRLTCAEAHELPIKCAGIPVRVSAVATPGGAVVCYHAMGAQFERARFEKRMDLLQERLTARFGPARVSSRRESCE